MKRFFYTQTDSTNLEARRLVHEKSENPPFWVVTGNQYAGRGHDKNSWESSPGVNFLGTYVFCPESINASKQFEISQLVSLGIVSFLELFIEDVKIKWPNDIYVGNRKIAGILIENEITGSNISLSSIGIGLNVNQEHFVSDAPNPVSMKQIFDIEYNLDEISLLLEKSVQDKVNLLQGVDIQYSECYLKYLYRYKQFAPYRSGNKWFEARIIGIGEFGELLLEEKSGNTLSFGFKEVEFLLS